jgi:VanZ family protein
MQMPKKLYRILSLRLPALLWTILIFVLLALPGNMLPNENHLSVPQLDKFVHVFLFGSFVFLWSFYFAAKRVHGNLHKTFLRITIIACLYGIAMEIIQKYFIPNRDFDLYDIISDCIGAIGGFLIMKVIVRRVTRFRG